jgi:hypothetical protein
MQQKRPSKSREIAQPRCPVHETLWACNTQPGRRDISTILPSRFRVDRMSHEIVKWQHSVLREASAEPSSSKTDGLASRLSRTASELFVLVLKHAQPQTPKALCRALEREYGYLQLWCDGYGAVSGELDDVLAESTRLTSLDVPAAGQSLSKPGG